MTSLTCLSGFDLVRTFDGATNTDTDADRTTDAIRSTRQVDDSRHVFSRIVNGNDVGIVSFVMSALTSLADNHLLQLEPNSRPTYRQCCVFVDDDDNKGKNSHSYRKLANNCNCNCNSDDDDNHDGRHMQAGQFVSTQFMS